MTSEIFLRIFTGILPVVLPEICLEIPSNTPAENPAKMLASASVGISIRTAQGISEFLLKIPSGMPAVTTPQKYGRGSL